MSCNMNASRFSGRQCVEHHEQRETDGIGQEYLVFGVDVVPAANDRLGHTCVLSGSSRHKLH
jgi:hypothetical protein